MARPRSEMGDIRTSPRNVRLLRWLRRKPTPAKIVGETEDGDEVSTVLSGTGSAMYTDACGVLRDCVKLTALDEKDRALRVLRLDPTDPELRAEAELADAVGSIARNTQGSVPIISVDLPKLVDNIARNMREVAGEAARQNANAHREGFTAMVSVVNIALNLLVGVEQRLANAEEALSTREPAVDGEDPDQRVKMALAALQQAMGAKSNGGGGAWDPTKLFGLVQSLQNAQPGSGDNGNS